jgi:trehalose 6-phosphate phosphatase
MHLPTAARLPCALDLAAGWAKDRRQAGVMLLALDFDGTLAPIVADPGNAVMLPAARPAMRTLLRRADMYLAVVSGRGLYDLRERVALDGVYLAGNHGLEIDGPGVHLVNAAARLARPALARCLGRIHRSLESEPAVILEDKELSLSVHFRTVEQPDAEARIRRAVIDACTMEKGIHLTHGRKVIEVRPAVAWDKGHATAFLMQELLPGGNGPVLFLGDDVSDEDAFRRLHGRGTGILVADALPASTAAGAWLRSIDDVVTLLERLADDAP